jgi:putative transposase
MEKSENASVDECASIAVGLADLPSESHERIEVLQGIISAPNAEIYRERFRLGMKRLSMTERSLRRLVRVYRCEGPSAVLPKERRDSGQHRVEEDWQSYILKTYRQGNREGRRMSRAQVWVRVKARAMELGIENVPGRATVYRILAPEIERRTRQVRSVGWRGERLSLTTRDGVRIEIESSNQVWQADHTPVDVLVVDAAGELLGRPWLTTVIDTYSRCVMGFYLGLEKPNSQTVCLALRHAILPKRYPPAYNLRMEWGTYGLPRHLYTDGGAEFRSKHLEAVAAVLKIDAYLRRRPSDGGIVERPFGTFNTELWSLLSGYTGSGVHERPAQAERSASLTLLEVERLFVRYIVERYNQGLDARMGNQTRFGRWEAGRITELPLLGERELDVCLMRREKRTVYRGGYIKFAGLVYRGEYLGACAGEMVVVRYTPRDITTVLVYRVESGKEVFLARAHAMDLETEELPLAEAQAIGRRLRAVGREVTNRSVLLEVQTRDTEVGTTKKGRTKSKAMKPTQPPPTPAPVPPKVRDLPAVSMPTEVPLEVASVVPIVEAPAVQVWEFDELREGWW